MRTTIHDNHILRYTVDLEVKEILFKTKTYDDALVDIRFSEVTAYFFEHTIMGCIIFDIAETTFEDFVADFSEEFLFEQSKYWWPIAFNDINDLKNKLGTTDCKIFTLSSSYGMSGVVLAKKMEVILS